jgi:hypothetical protein
MWSGDEGAGSFCKKKKTWEVEGTGGRFFAKKKHGRWRDLVIAKFNSKLIRKKRKVTRAAEIS